MCCWRPASAIPSASRARSPTTARPASAAAAMPPALAPTCRRRRRPGATGRQQHLPGKTILTGGTLQADRRGHQRGQQRRLQRRRQPASGLTTSNAGTLLLSSDVTQRAGSAVPGQFIWNGAGGFAAGTSAGITVALA